MPFFHKLLIIIVSTILLTCNSHAKDTGSKNLTKVKIQLRWKKSFQFAGILMAKEQGYFKDAGLDVEILEGTHSDVYKSLKNGTVQFGISDGSIIEKFSNGEPYVLVSAIFQKSPMVLVHEATETKTKIVNKGNIEDLKIVVKKKHMPLIHLLNRFGILGGKNVTIIPDDKELDYDSKLLNGEIDLMPEYSTAVKNLSEKYGVELSYISPSDYGVQSYGDSLITTVDFIEKNPQVVESFKDALIKGWNYTLSNRTEVMEHLYSIYKEGYYKDFTYDMVFRETNDIIGLLMHDVFPIGSVSKEKIKSIANDCVDVGICRNADNINRLLADYYLEKRNTNLYIYLSFALFFVVVFFMFKQKKLSKVLSQNALEIQRFEKIIEKNVKLSEIDLQGNIIQATEIMIKTFGLDTQANLKLENVLNEKSVQEIKTTILREQEWSGEIDVKNPLDGEKMVLKVVATPNIVDEEIIGIICIVENITLVRKFEKISIEDGLTGAYNRRHYDEVSKNIMAKTKKDKSTMCFAIADIDHFKEYNDTYGHDAGDEVLKNFTKTIDGILRRQSDYLFRLGGEEFGILVKNNKEQAYMLMQNIKNAIENMKIEHKKNSASDYITASFGLVSIGEQGEYKTMEQYYKEADELLYKSKKSGRNKISTNYDLTEAKRLMEQIKNNDRRKPDSKNSTAHK